MEELKKQLEELAAQIAGDISDHLNDKQLSVEYLECLIRGLATILPYLNDKK